VIGDALRQLRRWRDSGIDSALRGGRLSINLSAAQFRQAEFVATVARLLDETGVPGSAVELEITEAVAMGNEEQTIATLGALKALGVSVAIDDVGAGYSSLGYLQHFPIDRLKLDPSFARGESAAGGAVGALVAMGHGLRLSTSAEGIETAAQVERLRAAGCSRGQGFLFARPMAADAAAEYLRQWS
jgi:EAL domain-containing protein (putative c-di-GMP-specific phosphodiesterase class I)